MKHKEKRTVPGVMPFVSGEPGQADPGQSSASLLVRMASACHGEMSIDLKSQEDPLGETKACALLLHTCLNLGFLQSRVSAKD